MKSQKKILKFLVFNFLFVLSIQNIFFGLVYAADSDENCLVCSRMSNEMQLYVNFQVEMIGELAQVKKEKINYTGLTRRGLFSYGIASVGSNIISSIKQSVDKATQSSVDTVRLAEISSLIVSKNSIYEVGGGLMGDFLILFRNRVFLRDWNNLKDIDSTIDDLIWDIGMEGKLNSKLSDETLKNLNQISKKYIGDGLIFDSFQIGASSSYSDVILSLASLNLLMENFFSIDSIFEYKKNVKLSQGEIEDKYGLYLLFNEDYLQKLSTGYECARGISACNGGTTFFSDMNSIIQNQGARFQKALEQIEKSNSELKDSAHLKKNNQKNDDDQFFTDAQKELLSSVYGIDASKMTNEERNFVKKFLSFSFSTNHILFDSDISTNGIDSNFINTKKNDKKNEDKESINESIGLTKKDLRKRKRELRKSVRLGNKCMKMLDKYGLDKFKSMEEWNDCEGFFGENGILLKDDITPYMSNDKNFQDFVGMINYLNGTIDSVLVDLDSDNILLQSVGTKVDTTYFIQIGYYIHHIVNDIIGSQGQNNTIVKNLGNACEYQCANKNDKKECYY